MQKIHLFVACVSLSLFSFLSTPSTFAEVDTGYHCRSPYSGGPGVSSPPPESIYNLPYLWTLDISGQKYDVHFAGYIANATANIDKRSIAFDGRSEGELLQVRLPRALIDSTQDNQDVPFTVLVNGQPIHNTTQVVVPSSGDRVICIPLASFGPVARVEIIGTTIAPEFGSLAAVVAAIILSVIVVAFRISSSKNRRIQASHGFS